MSSFAARRRGGEAKDGAAGMWIPGLGENKPRPQSSQSPRSGGSGAISGNSDGGSSRSSSPAPDRIQGRRRPRTAGDSSQLRDALWHPKSPDQERVEVDEDLCVETIIPVTKATPFFDHASGRKILIKGGLIVNDDGVQAADVLVDEGLIVKVEADLDPEGDARVIDARDKLVLPGGIDASTNLFYGGGDASLPQVADDFETGTRAALAGGTTMVMDLVVPRRGQGESLSETFGRWKAEAETKAHCDFAFRVALTEWNDDMKEQMRELVKAEGVNAFKVYMAFKHEKMLTNDQIMDVFKTCRELGAVALVHAENGDIIAENEKRLLARGVSGPEGHIMARPEEIEEEAVLRASALATQANVPLVVCSPTSKEAVQIIAKEKARGHVVAGEVTAAALAVDGSNYFSQCWNHAAGFVASPPLRDDPNTPEALTEAMVAGNLEMVVSDNCTFATDVKEKFGRRGNFTQIPQGLNGIEDRMSVVWEKGVEGGKMTPEQFVAATSSNAARSFNLYPRKGRIAEGSDADIVVWNKNNLRRISSKTHQQAVDFNVFEGLKVHGAPEFVLAGGRVVVFEYELNADPGSGGFVEAAAFPAKLYDAVDDAERARAAFKAGVARSEEEEDFVDGGRRSTGSNGAGDDPLLGVTTPRRSVEEPILNKRLGIYQRPMSAHGVRNQQDSTFSLAGGCEGEPRRASVKVNAPPGGGKGGAFW